MARALLHVGGEWHRVPFLDVPGDERRFGDIPIELLFRAQAVAYENGFLWKNKIGSGLTVPDPHTIPFADAQTLLKL